MLKEDSAVEARGNSEILLFFLDFQVRTGQNDENVEVPGWSLESSALDLSLPIRLAKIVQSIAGPKRGQRQAERDLKGIATISSVHTSHSNLVSVFASPSTALLVVQLSYCENWDDCGLFVHR
ncbi:hypothetical protein LENED_008871 [Lentinula edodes]|uniref:Uncharacterized protein n=1 Tax=Lentinula edodes TaxID=5353 RepID=A0A1Q3EI96_LENED|nr:hypothetical protein LENED_008871 [Lentinula edodes]